MNVLRKETNQQASQRGFTIIEVVLVLAIAGLIFLMVFIALPALQASQRDTARKNDVSTVAAGVTQYTSNNRGVFPDSAAIASYVKNVSDNSLNSAGAPNVIVKTKGVTKVTTADSEIDIVQSVTCGGTDSADKTAEDLSAGTTRQFVVLTKLEAGGGSAYCQDS